MGIFNRVKLTPFSTGVFLSLSLLLTGCSEPQGINAQTNEAPTNESPVKDYPDSDSDGLPDHIDAFPNDPNEMLDSDGDGIGNNSDTDDDNDGIPDNMDLKPYDPNTDDIPPVMTGELDDDGNGIPNVMDAFPNDKNEILDTDGDGIGNNTDTDDDNDGIPDATDSMPLTVNQPQDSNALTAIEQLGKSYWDNQSCATCHGADGKGVNGKHSLIDSLQNNQFIMATADTMPFGNPTACDVDCATAIAQWMKTLNTDESQPIDPIKVTYDTNIALGKLVAQSSHYNSNKYPPEAAIDGNLNTFNHTQSSSELNPWWEIDLGSNQFVHNVVLTSRSGYDHRSRDLTIVISNTPINHITSEAANADDTVSVFSTGNINGSATIEVQENSRYIRVIGYRQYINFAEFQVFGAAPITGDTDDTQPVDSSEPDDSNPVDTIGEYCTDTQEAKPRVVRLLTNREYQNTINDIFGISALQSVATVFPGSTNTHGFDNNASAEVLNESRINAYWAASDTIAHKIVEEQLDEWANCDKNKSACLQQYVETLGFSLYRRPLTDNEITDQLALATSTFDETAYHIAKAMLMSPHFLYRFELGELTDGVYILTPYEAASLLSYNYLGTSPDTQLYEAAARNELQSAAQLRTQVSRLLKDSRAQKNMIHFAKQWFNAINMGVVTKDSDAFPLFSESIGQAMETEFELFISEVLLGENSNFSELVDADYIFANRELANYYGLTAPTNTFSKISAGSERGGILRMGALLATHASSNSTSPIVRGQFVRERLMCQELPQPPENADLTPPALDPTKPTRERFEAHTESEQCASCHKYMDDIGFALESFDGSGMFRLTEAGRNIDTTGVLLGLASITDTQEYVFSNIDDVINMLEDSQSTTQCVVEQFERFSSGVDHGSQCMVKSTAQRWQKSGYNFKQLWLEMVSSTLFLIRQ